MKITGFGILDYFTFMELFTIHLPILTEVSTKRSPIDNVTFRIPTSRSIGSGFGEISNAKDRAANE